MAEKKGSSEKGEKMRQLRALLLKNVSVQKKQSGTNCCQIVTPLICILLVYVIKSVSGDLVVAGAKAGSLLFMFNEPNYIDYLILKKVIVQPTCLQWFYFSFSKQVSQATKQYVGQNDGLHHKTGMMSNLHQKQCTYHAQSKQITKEVPFFQQNTNPNQAIYRSILELNKKNFTRFKDQTGLYAVPDGTIEFQKVDSKHLEYKVQINDLYLAEYHRSNSFSKLNFRVMNENGTISDKVRPSLIVGEGQLGLVDLVNKAYIKSIDKKAELVSGSLYMPMTDNNDQYIDRLINMSGGSLFPLALGLLLPVFMYQVVLEKEQRIIQMMKMNGLNMSVYWFSNFLFNILMYTITVIIFLFSGFFLLNMTFFTQTSPLLFFLLFLGWGIAQIAIAFFVQVFINKAKTASIIGYLLSIWVILIGVSFNIGIYPYPHELPYPMRMVPTLGFCRIIYRMAEACSEGLCLSSLSILNNGVNQEIIDCLIWLYLSSLILFSLTAYLDQVIPQEFGVNRHPLFPFHYLLSLCSSPPPPPSPPLQEELKVNQSRLEDEDSKKERKKAMEAKEGEYSLLIKDIRKEYEGGKVAVEQLSLTVKEGEIFGLLGPNGAGKTSLISMLTGLYGVTSGDALINDQSILTNIIQTQKNIGICPQFDLLWPQLTIYQHLLFYVRLKGVSSSQEKKLVDDAIESVLLTEHKQKESSQLSGGMRRRLSVAISMVGRPQVVFLDEPTTGLDPENKRQLWDIIIQQQKGSSSSDKQQSIIITTHSMEEADVLCNRIGIMQNGVLRCIAPQLRLKQMYGGGYHLTINLKKQSTIPSQSYSLLVEQAITFIQHLSGGSDQVQLLNRVNGNLDFIILNNQIKISQIFTQVEENKANLFIQEWGITQSSLEDVFVHIVTNRNAILESSIEPEL